MKNLFKSVVGGAAMLGLCMAGTAQAEPDYMYAATGFVSGGGAWLSFNDCQGDGCDDDIAKIVAGGDFVIPLRGYWNVQLGGAFHTEHLDFSGGGSASTTQFQGSAIGFWRDPAAGVFGIEVGVFSPFGDSRRRGRQNSIKIGGVAEYFFSDAVAIGGFGGVLIPIDPHPFGPDSTEFDTGYYAGGHLTYYASDTLAFAGYARFVELNESFDSGQISSSRTQRAIKVGGKVRHLTNMPGVEVYASAGYLKCEEESTRGPGTFTFYQDGAQVMAGVKVRLGGHADSLVNIDRSNAIDTRAWACGIGASPR